MFFRVLTKLKARAVTALRHQSTTSTTRHLQQQGAPVVSSSPVRAVRSSGRDAIDVDIGLHAQNRLVLSFSRHLGSTVIDVVVVVTHLFTLVS